MIRIKARHTKPLASTVPPAAPGIALSLRDKVENSVVDQIWITNEAYQAICTWVEASLGLDPIPEVGGFLGGVKIQQSSGWHTYITGFMPARTVNFQSPVRIDFGSQALLDWDNYRQQQPELELVGWFHTHPGLTPYLSWTDLNTQYGFFGHPAQLAVVLDPLTDEWDTAFFSWQNAETMNNKTDLRSYFSWHSIFSD